MISEKDVKDNFIVLHNYGENADYWPRNTIVLSTVTITRNNKKNETKKWIHRNEPRGMHAEKRFLQELEKTIELSEVNEVKVKLVQNYSPCLTCAEAFLEFKNKIEGTNGKVFLTIKFANFYKVYKKKKETE